MSAATRVRAEGRGGASRGNCTTRACAGLGGKAIRSRFHALERRLTEIETDEIWGTRGSTGVVVIPCAQNGGTYTHETYSHWKAGQLGQLVRDSPIVLVDSSYVRADANASWIKPFRKVRQKTISRYRAGSASGETIRCTADAISRLCVFVGPVVM